MGRVKQVSAKMTARGSKTKGAETALVPLAELKLHRNRDQRRVILTPKQEDVLLGRGPAAARHNHNTLWKVLTDQKRNRFIHGTRKDKNLVADYILDQVRGIGGRFLERRDPEDKKWYEVADKVAREKTCRLLRTREKTFVTAAKNTEGCSESATRDTDDESSAQNGREGAEDLVTLADEEEKEEVPPDSAEVDKMEIDARIVLANWQQKAQTRMDDLDPSGGSVASRDEQPSLQSENQLAQTAARAQCQPMDEVENYVGDRQTNGFDQGDVPPESWTELMIRDSVLRNVLEGASDEDLYHLFDRGTGPPLGQSSTHASRPQSSSGEIRINASHASNPTTVQRAFEQSVEGNQVDFAFSRPASSNSRLLAATLQSVGGFQESPAALQPPLLLHQESGCSQDFSIDFSVSSIKRNIDDISKGMKLLESPKLSSLETPGTVAAATLGYPAIDSDLAPPPMLELGGEESSMDKSSQAMLQEIQALNESFLKIQQEQALAIHKLNDSRTEIFSIGWDQHHTHVAFTSLRRACEEIQTGHVSARAQLDDLAESRPSRTCWV